MAIPKRILYVEDNPNNRTLVRRALEVRGYEIIDAEDGLTGVRLARELLPDLVLMDMDIPGLNGFEATTRLRGLAETQHIPVVALTASVSREERERCLAAGCNGFISKPVGIRELQDQVDRFLAGHEERITPQRRGELLAEYSQQLVVRLETQIRELQRANAALAKIDRLKSDFLVLASHELRTPLTVIKGYGALLALDLSQESAQRQMMLSAIARGADRLDEVVDEMLEVSEIETGNLDIHPETVDLAPLLLQSVEHMRERIAEAGRNLTLAYEAAPNGLPVNGDAARLRRAFENVIGNAVKYTPDSGQITINTVTLDEPPPSSSARGLPGPRSTANAAVPARFVDVCISDTGIGVPLSEQELIFEKFYVIEDTDYHSTNQMAFMGGGVGLGLAIVKGTIEAHGGRVWVESAGRDAANCPGSRFHLLLPVVRAISRPTPP
jgi:signal transduction histidine kinase